MTRVVVILASLLALVVASPAAASTFAGERPSSSPLVADFVELGLEHWHARGVFPCAPPALEVLEAPALVADDDGDGDVEEGELSGDRGAGGRAELGGCRLWLRAGFVRAAERERWRPNVYVEERLELCETIVHELGHVAGLEHGHDDVMAAVGSARPWACRVWVGRLVRAERRAHAARARARARR